jgi:integrase
VSVHQHYVAIKQFYESNEVIVNWRIVNNYVGSYNKMKSSIDLPYIYEEIHKMLDKADERKRVVILLLASTGMRRGAIP